jgi:2-polyprenyl-3-methyl-5-hydroxy-6-metoxy-1,4-benzoquinol methylase
LRYRDRVTATAHPRTCNVCEKPTPDGAASVEVGRVRSNVRAFRAETFAYWRCPNCKSLHAEDDVDLAHYYARYPFHALATDWRLRAMYQVQLDRLLRAGVTRASRVLDYGCGGGQFVGFLREKGFADVHGYDQYSAEFGDAKVLDQSFDCILSQDVIEHVPAPHALLATFQELTRPGAVVAVGTPDAMAIDLAHPDAFVHTLHAPYHRHILAKDALVQAGERQGWALDRFYPTMYSNTRVPFLNEAFYLYYTRVCDDTLDALMEPVKAGALMVRAPVTLFYGFFGAMLSRGTDVMAIFKRPA